MSRVLGLGIRNAFRPNSLTRVSNVPLLHSARHISNLPVESSGWAGLGGFASTHDAQNAWKNLRNAEEEVATVIERYPHVTSSGIDWNYWEKIIKHETLVKSLKAAYDQQMTILEGLKVNNGEEFHNDIDDKAWELYKEAMRSCERAVEGSEKLVADGARALWVSHRNPPAWAVATEEWVDSDLHWQAYIERHHHYDPAKDIESYRSDTFEDEGVIEARRKEWRKKVDLFHERSDTPTLYSYMDQLHSSDFYDLHRRIFLEHMIYFLVRTGNDHHFFPEIPPTSWITDIERLRYRYISKAHKRRITRQLETLNRNEPLDLCPPDSELDHSEDHFYKLLNIERNNWECFAGRLMADYIFLCHPAIPCLSISDLRKATAVDDGAGSIFSLGQNVSPVFYVPSGVAKPFSHEKASSLLSPPRQSIENLLKHVVSTGQIINPGYVEILRMHADVLEKRGPHWFTAPNEGVAEAFLRRLSPEDPSSRIYQIYVAELEDLWVNHSHKLSIQGALQHLKDAPFNTQLLEEAVTLLKENFGAEDQMTSAKKLCLEILELQDKENVEKALANKGIVMVDEKMEKLQDIQEIIKRINEHKNLRAALNEAITTTKTE